jgi:hypothetical protein
MLKYLVNASIKNSISSLSSYTESKAMRVSKACLISPNIFYSAMFFSPMLIVDKEKYRCEICQQ